MVASLGSGWAMRSHSASARPRVAVLDLRPIVAAATDSDTQTV
jgi:hypothetical protein